jgi:hypothetical protein
MATEDGRTIFVTSAERFHLLATLAASTTTIRSATADSRAGCKWQELGLGSKSLDRSTFDALLGGVGFSRML